MSLARNLTRARERAGLTQAELARKLKKSRSSVQEYEAGKHQPRLSVLVQIARITKTALAELID
jgi:transcriptional regulator with XRE-family HTH domain